MSPRKPKYTELNAQIAAVKAIREMLVKRHAAKDYAISTGVVIDLIDEALAAK